MCIFLAIVFLAAAFFAEPIVEQMPGLATAGRSVIDDFGAGDPKKVVKYKPSIAQIISHGMDSAHIKYKRNGYIMATGIKAHTEQERRTLKATPKGGNVNVYYDDVNPTIVVMQPTYLLAVRKMKGRSSSSGRPKHKKHFIPGKGFNTKVNHFRIGCVCIGLFFLFFGARQLKAM